MSTDSTPNTPDADNNRPAAPRRRNAAGWVLGSILLLSIPGSYLYYKHVEALEQRAATLEQSAQLAEKRATLAEEQATVNEQYYIELTNKLSKLTEENSSKENKRYAQQQVRFRLKSKNIAEHQYPSALSNAIKNNAGALFTELINSGMDINNELPGGGTSIYQAAALGNVKFVKQLIDAGADVNKGKQNQQSTPLMIAAAKGHIEIVNMLLAAKASVNDADSNAMTPLLHAVAHPDITKIIIAAGANVNHENNKGETALHLAAEGDYVQTVQALIVAGAQLNHVDKKGRTPLSRAKGTFKEGAAAKVLRDAGAR